MSKITNTILGTGLVLGLLYLCSKCDFSESEESFTIPEFDFEFDLDDPIPRNSKDAAIDALYNTGKEADWDSEKIRIARDIFSVVKNKEVSESTRAYAIDKLSKLAATCDWTSNKMTIDGIILDISKL